MARRWKRKRTVKSAGKKRVRKPVAVPVPEVGAGADDVLVLGVDQSSSASGWAIWFHGRIQASGVAKKGVDRRAVVENVSDFVRDLGLVPIVVVEDLRRFRFGRGNLNVAGLMGMGAALGMWQQEFEMAGLRDVRRVEPRVWRAAILGLSERTKREDAKEAAKLYARAILGRAVSDDEAEGCALAIYGIRMFAPKRPRRRKAS